MTLLWWFGVGLGLSLWFGLGVGLVFSSFCFLVVGFFSLCPWLGVLVLGLLVFVESWVYFLWGSLGLGQCVLPVWGSLESFGCLSLVVIFVFGLFLVLVL